MGLTLSRSELKDMERALVERLPPMDPFESPFDAPKAVSVVAGVSTFGLLLSVRFADASVQTVMLNPVVSYALGRVCLVANDERGWWGEDGAWKDVPYAPDELEHMQAALQESLPPVPGMLEYQLAPHAVSVFGGSGPIGMLLKLRLEDGSVVAWMLSPVVVMNLMALISDGAQRLEWWDESGEFITADALH